MSFEEVKERKSFFRHKKSEKSLIMAHTAKHIIMIPLFMTFPGNFLLCVFAFPQKNSSEKFSFNAFVLKGKTAINYLLRILSSPESKTQENKTIT